MSSQLRMTGLISGLDTESIISALVSTKQIKVDSAKAEQTKLSWKQEVWKDLNTQLTSLQSSLANMRFTSAYQKKTTTASDSNKVSVITGSDAVNSVQSLKIDQLAKTAYLTGGVVSKTDSSKATAMTKLSDLGFTGSGTLDLKDGDGNVTKTISVSGDSTINDLLTSLQDAGLNASFDAKNQRLFISSKKSGEDNNFTLTSSDADGNDALAKLGLQSKSYYEGLTSVSDSDVAASAEKKLKSYLSQYNTKMASMAKLNKTIQATKDVIDNEYSGSYDDAVSGTDAKLSDANDALKTAKESLTSAQKELNALDASDEDYETKRAQLQANVDSAQTSVDDAQKNVDDLTELQTNLKNYTANQESAATLKTETDSLAEYFSDLSSETTTDDDGNEVITYTATTPSQKLTDEVKATYQQRVDDAAAITANSSTNSYAVKVEGSNAKITLNGAEFTSNTNVFNINGLTLTTMGTTAEGDEITLTTENDTSGIYDMVKNFLKNYNTVMNKMDALYNADSASDYEPLTDDEKDAMSDSEVEKYEQKIKDALLKSDSTINSISSALTSIIGSGFKVNGKMTYLSDFGISTLSYFSAAENEKHALHIDGDSDDTDTASNTDKLKAAITNDPDSVVDFFTQLSQKLYSKMSDLSSSVSGYRTFGSFYNDKKMSSDYSSYSSKISDLEDKMNDYEDKLYSQYSDMETALAKLQSNSSSVTSLLGS